MALQFREKDVVGDRVKGFTKIQVDDIHRFSLVHPCCFNRSPKRKISSSP